MLLAINIGNTNVKLGLFDGTELVGNFRLRSDRDRTGDEYGVQFQSLLSARGLSLSQIKGVAVASVVPRVMEAWQGVCDRFLRLPPLVITGESEIGLINTYQPPRSVGADRFVNAYAAHHLYSEDSDSLHRPRHCIIVDYGTATTFDAVTAEGVYRGGAILPGIHISMDALFSQTAQLARVEISPPDHAIATNTADALRSGVLFGYAAQTDGMVERFCDELHGNCRVIATGGLAPLITPHTKNVDKVDTRLTLNGLRLLYERSKKAPE